jgi:hypothetical protein
MGPAHRSRFRSRAAVIVTLAALPILWTPNVVVVRKVVGGFRVAIPGALLLRLTGGLPRAMKFSVRPVSMNGNGNARAAASFSIS